MAGLFVVARNPEDRTRLPYLLLIPVDGGLVLKAREPWPRTARVYCHPYEGRWSADLEVVDEIPIRHCSRRGSAVDLVLDRARENRSQFVFTQLRGRPAIFWQTPKAARAARPGLRVPGRRASGLTNLTITVDTGERYAYRFAGRAVTIERRRLQAGDYAVLGLDSEVVAAVERKSPEDLASSINSGVLTFQLTELASLALAAVVVDGRYESLLKTTYAQPGWLADALARLAVRYPSVGVVFAGSRKLAEDWTYRFLAAAAVEAGVVDTMGAPEESHSPA